MPLGVRRSATSPDMRGAKPGRSTLGPQHPGVFHAVLILAFLILRMAQMTRRTSTSPLAVARRVRDSLMHLHARHHLERPLPAPRAVAGQGALFAP